VLPAPVRIALIDRGSPRWRRAFRTCPDGVAATRFTLARVDRGWSVTGRATANSVSNWRSCMGVGPYRPGVGTAAWGCSMRAKKAAYARYR
jgi:hypothetical protein